MDWVAENANKIGFVGLGIIIVVMAVMAYFEGWHQK